MTLPASRRVSRARAAWVSSAATARRQIGGDQRNAVFDAQRQQFGHRVGGVTTFGRLGEDYSLNVYLRLSLDREWGVGVQAPLRFWIIRRAPFKLAFGEDPDVPHRGGRAHRRDRLSRCHRRRSGRSRGPSRPTW